MRNFKSQVGIACMGLLCALFLFEMVSAQGGIDFGVYDCSVEKIPGVDSVLVTATLEYVVADSVADSVDLHYVVTFDDNVVQSGYLHFSRAVASDCYKGEGPCSDRYCVPITGSIGADCQGYGICECLYHCVPPTFRLEEPCSTETTAISLEVDDLFAIPEFDETNNECLTYYTSTAIPTLGEWGLIIFGVVLLGFITWVFLRRRKAAAVSLW